MYLFATDGKTVLTRSTPEATGSALILFNPASSGQYYIQIKNQDDKGGAAMRYTISLSLAH